MTPESMSDERPDEKEAMAQTLRDAGYIVFRAECGWDFPHGRHTLKTRSAICEGTADAPHGCHSIFHGTFGTWVNCACGHSFADYAPGGEPSNWQKHKAEHLLP